MNSLFQLYEYIRPNISDRIISPRYHEKISALFKTLPITGLLNLEMRMDGLNEQVDANLLVRQSDNLILKDWIEYTKMRDPLNLTEWVSKWNDPNSFLNNALKNIWMMFDINDDIVEIPEPWIIITMASKGLPPDIIRLMYEKASLHFDTGFKQHHWEKFEDVISEMPEGYFMPGIGFLNRGKQQFRFGIKPFPNIKEVNKFLEAINWKGDLEFLEKYYDFPARNAFTCDVSLTIDDDLLPTVGLECYLRKDDNLAHASEVLSFLVEKGWSVPEYKTALESYVGETLVPGSLFDTRRGKKEDLPDVVIERWVSSFKMIFTPNNPPSAKAYIIFSKKL